MIDRDHGPSVSHEAKVLGISRGSVYYLLRPTSEADLVLCAGSTSCIWSIRSRGVGC
jgi:hypothetical protein